MLSNQNNYRTQIKGMFCQGTSQNCESKIKLVLTISKFVECKKCIKSFYL